MSVELLAAERALTGIQKEADERLLIEAAQRDPQQFAVLYERNFDRIYAFIAKRSKDRDSAEDLTSEVFHKALANLSQFEWRGAPFIAWLFKIARNALADRYYNASREENRPEFELTNQDNSDEVEQRAILSQLVEQLPTDQKTVILARFVEQKSIRQIAESLRRTEGAVKQLQFRALENLRTRFRRADA
jgi:RNA polymerase sigma-70 factor (ECF subfamily)